MAEATAVEVQPGREVATEADEVQEHSLATVAGRFRDDPLWEAMMEAIAERRRQIDDEDAE